jgi:hypothetical protein
MILRIDIGGAPTVRWPSSPQEDARSCEPMTVRAAMDEIPTYLRKATPQRGLFIVKEYTTKCDTKVN